MESFVGEPINTQGGQIFINPGTGPVADATEVEARKNMCQLIIDAEITGARVRRKSKLDDRGRFGFRVVYADQSWDIEMPGLPLERVRFQPGLDPWQFPRLYVDGSSWLWEFAVSIMKREKG